MVMVVFMEMEMAWRVANRPEPVLFHSGHPPLSEARDTYVAGL